MMRSVSYQHLCASGVRNPLHAPLLGGKHFQFKIVFSVCLVRSEASTILQFSCYVPIVTGSEIFGVGVTYRPPRNSTGVGEGWLNGRHVCGSCFFHRTQLFR